MWWLFCWLLQQQQLLATLAVSSSSSCSFLRCSYAIRVDVVMLILHGLLERHGMISVI